MNDGMYLKKNVPKKTIIWINCAIVLVICIVSIRLCYY